MEQNWYIIPLTAFIPLIIGFVWYSPAVFGATLAEATGNSSEQISTSKGITRVVLIYVFSIFLSYILTILCVHQLAVVFQLFFLEPSLAEAGTEFNSFVAEFIEKYGDRHRSFGHGMLHGTEAGLCFGLPLIGISTFMEGKPLKVFGIHLGFWALCCGIMGGLNCAFF